jgi:hypothetical protein
MTVRPALPRGQPPPRRGEKEESMQTSTERILMLPMAEIPWVDRSPFDGEWLSPAPPPPWTLPWCREQQMRAFEQGHAFYEGRYDY